jgi:hypothetical protein
MPKKPKSKKRKRGPVEERLIIKGDPLKAVDALLKKNPQPTK